MAKASKYVEEFEDRYGLTTSFLGKFEFEDEKEFDYSVYFDPDDSDSEYEEISNMHHNILRYLKQIRESFGFDVDCRVPSWFDGPFTPIDLAKVKTSGTGEYAAIMEAAECAIREINDEKRGEKRYEMVEVEKVVLTINMFFLLTIKVKEFADANANANANDDAVLRTIQALVYEPPGAGGGPVLEQWRFKPAAHPAPAVVEQAQQQA